MYNAVDFPQGFVSADLRVPQSRRFTCRSSGEVLPRHVVIDLPPPTPPHGEVADNLGDESLRVIFINLEFFCSTYLNVLITDKYIVKFNWNGLIFMNEYNYLILILECVPCITYYLNSFSQLMSQQNLFRRSSGSL